MKFTVEVEDFYLEEGELAAELKHQIKTSVVADIRGIIKKQVDDFMDAHVKSVINVELQTRVQLLMDEFMTNGMVKGRYNSDQAMTVKQWIAESFTSKHADIVESIKKQTAAHVKDIQHRYDILFASQLITKMKDQGFIKEDIAKLLLDEKTN